MHAKYDSIQFAGTSYLLRAYLEVVNIASGSEANITTSCEMNIFQLSVGYFFEGTFWIKDFVV